MLACESTCGYIGVIVLRYTPPNTVTQNQNKASLIQILNHLRLMTGALLKEQACSY